MTPYRDAAHIYRDAGWGGVLPLPPGKKDAPPKGCTGWNGKDPSDHMVQMWCGETRGDHQANSNIAIRMPVDVVGIDVDHYGNKTGGDTLTKLEAGARATTKNVEIRITARHLRHLWYRVEPGLRWPTGPGKSIEFIHTGHRYAIVAPSIHPNGARYMWWDPDGNTPEGSRYRPMMSCRGCPTNGKYGSPPETTAANNPNTGQPPTRSGHSA